MTIFVRWSMKPNELLLLLFYFVDDFRKANLRGGLYSYGSGSSIADLDKFRDKSKVGLHELKPIISLSTSHVEQGLMSELLSLANRVNGSKARSKFYEFVSGLSGISTWIHCKAEDPDFNAICPWFKTLGLDVTILDLAPRGVRKWLLNLGFYCFGFENGPFIGWALNEESIRYFTEAFEEAEEDCSNPLWDKQRTANWFMKHWRDQE